MDRVSDEALDLMIDWNERIQAYQVVDALTELRERREAEKKDECSICHKPFSHVH